MHLWKSLALPVSATLEDAIAKINDGGAQIALIVEEEDHLAGVVTDGDIRRGLLRHLPLSAPVTTVMSKPLTVPPSTPQSEIRALMRKHRLSHIPVVDGQGRIIALDCLREQIDAPRFDNLVFLMAGGFGKRLKPLTDTTPKPMLRISGKPILEMILEQLLEQGFHRFCISVHYKGEQIRAHFGDGSRWQADITYVEEDTPLGTAGALSLLPAAESLPVLVLNGDLLNQVNFGELIQFHQRNGACATLCGLTQTYQVPYGVLEAQGTRLTGIVEKPTYRHLVNAGIYVLNAEVIAGLAQHEPLDMPDLLQNLIDRQQPVHIFPIFEYWLDIGRPEDFARAGGAFAFPAS